MVTNSKSAPRHPASPGAVLQIYNAPADFDGPVTEDHFSRADQSILDDLDRVLNKGMIDELRISVCNFSQGGKPITDCGLMMLSDGTGVGVSPEMLLMLLNHPKFHRRPSPIVLMADIRQDPNLTFEMMAADGPECESDSLIDPDTEFELIIEPE